MDLSVIASFLFVGILEIVLPLGISCYLIKKRKLSWKIFGYGALFAVLVQVFHIPIINNIQEPVILFIENNIPSKSTGMLLFSLFIGFLAGVFEEPARYLVFKYFFTDKKKKLNKSGALLFGLGWGGIESILIAVLVLSSMIFYINAKPLSETDISAINQTMNGTMTENDVLLYNEQIASIGKLSPLDVLPGLLERIIAITIHIFFTLLVFKSVRENKLKYLIFAVMLHTLFDTLAVFINSEYGVLLTEFILLLIAVPAFFYIKKESLKI